MCLCNLLEVQNYFKIQSGRKDAVSSGKKAASWGRSKGSNRPVRSARDRATCLWVQHSLESASPRGPWGALPSQGAQLTFPRQSRPSQRPWEEKPVAPDTNHPTLPLLTRLSPACSPARGAGGRSPESCTPAYVLPSACIGEPTVRSQPTPSPSWGAPYVRHVTCGIVFPLSVNTWPFLSSSLYVSVPLLFHHLHFTLS